MPEGLTAVPPEETKEPWTGSPEQWKAADQQVVESAQNQHRQDDKIRTGTGDFKPDHDEPLKTISTERRPVDPYEANIRATTPDNPELRQSMEAKPEPVASEAPTMVSKPWWKKIFSRN